MVRDLLHRTLERDERRQLLTAHSLNLFISRTAQTYQLTSPQRQKSNLLIEMRILLSYPDTTKDHTAFTL